MHYSQLKLTILPFKLKSSTFLILSSRSQKPWTWRFNKVS